MLSSIYFAPGPHEKASSAQPPANHTLGTCTPMDHRHLALVFKLTHRPWNRADNRRKFVSWSADWTLLFTISLIDSLFLLEYKSLAFPEKILSSFHTTTTQTKTHINTLHIQHAAPAPLQQHHCTSTTAPAPLHQHHCTSTTAPAPLHQHHCTSTTAPAPLHQHHCTSTTAPAPLHQHHRLHHKLHRHQHHTAPASHCTSITLHQHHTAPAPQATPQAAPQRPQHKSTLNKMGCCGSKQARSIANEETAAVRSNPYGRPENQPTMGQVMVDNNGASYSVPSASRHTPVTNSSVNSNRAIAGTRSSRQTTTASDPYSRVQNGARGQKYTGSNYSHDWVGTRSSSAA